MLVVEDDWARDMNPDVLHVTYDRSRLTTEDLLRSIENEGFEAEVTDP